MMSMLNNLGFTELFSYHFFEMRKFVSVVISVLFPAGKFKAIHGNFIH